MTVDELRAALASYPGKMPVAVRSEQVPGTQGPEREVPYCVHVDELAVRVIWLEEEGGYTSPADDAPAPIPTLIINNGYEL